MKSVYSHYPSVVMFWLLGVHSFIYLSIFYGIFAALAIISSPADAVANRIRQKSLTVGLHGFLLLDFKIMFPSEVQQFDLCGFTPEA